MPTFRAIRSGLVVLALVLSPIGCSGPAEPEVTAPPVDSRFASAEAMVEYFNSLTTVSPVRLKELKQIVHTETVVQERIMRLFGGMDPIIGLNEEVMRQFGEPLDENASSLQFPNNQPARLTTNDGQRAQAVFLDDVGKESTLYLVKMGDRWWVSGYTFEYSPGAVTDIKELAAIEEMMTLAGNVSSDLIPRVKAGEFSTLDECKAAYGMAIMGYMMQHPDQFKNLEEAIKSGNSPIGP